MAVASGRVQLVTIRQQSLTLARWRVLWVVLGFAFIAMLALVRIAYLGMSDEGLRGTSLEEALLPPRGEITDRNGIPLARAFPAYALWFNPEALGEGGTPLVREPAVVAAKLKAIFPDLNEKAVAAQFAAGKQGYIRRRVLPEEANRVQEIGELALEMPTETDRHYPQGSMAAHVLGYVAADGDGRVGMEQVFNKHLSDPATRGTPIALSIDSRVQGALEDELRRGMKLVQAQGGAGIVLDVNTGEVLALASLPEFDPNKIDARGEKLMFNRVTNQVYELGSTFKPLSVAAAIDAGVVRDLGRRWDATPVKAGRFRIKDSHDMGATLNVVETLIHSSNTVTARVVDELGPERMRRYMMDLGMNERPYIELPAKGFPIWPGEKWPRLRSMTVGYGHGIAVTPLHLASAYAAMVNGGIWRPATLKKLGPGEAPKGRRVFKASTSSRMRQLLRAISIYGTGRNADAPGYRVGGKTGSAEKPGGSAGYRRTALVSTFAAAFPMDRPRYVVIAMLDEPRGTVASSYQRTAAWNAAPIVGRLVPRIGPLIGVRPDDTRDVDISDIKPLIPEANR
ncbi:penicillin-binding protein 2 [Qipengyuania citrea]|uniref:Penicillin-binding protein 2 n=1 Tax=Qipengyuania citrea TaxID=225971 RepID=A0ABY4U9P2_9SPHN|nr:MULTISPECIES: penicillin-binding protein 2 [Erythrobacteraceae]MCH2496155.1 penicillin-binding protein 2 [Erythrobacter sp.]MEC7888464.1 penicillin-binding protein 2 [Pseudomonadota bacterium]MBY8333295.1 penicillin-binding protein 2 [Qipengyuania pacifica]MEC7953257.1 penicillin-binding protein 2 [Pseudomonadota bacterium]PHR05524.1 MAG: peptidoglycan glycosyltransferase [Erythrobacter sp.]|tara:strand:- start:1043 stop:2746 length:1704 start_codon:yes stop_codon:yes gene_type:complete